MKTLPLFLIFLLACCISGCQPTPTPSAVESITIQNGQVNYYLKGLDRPFNVLFLSDSHITIEDERGKDFYNYTKRMGGSAVNPENYGQTNGREKTFLASLELAKKDHAELVILGGDIINFPSLASVEYIRSIMDQSGLKWVYTSGNHDWHYEGEPGKSSDHRQKWTHSNLAPLYQGENPMYRAVIVNGINFITLDDSDFIITEEQYTFMEEQIRKGLPIILSMHIPLYVKGHDIDYGCGHPDWNFDHDKYYKIEKREPWPKDGLTETTFKFRQLVFDSPEVIGILAGHTHHECVDYLKGKIQYVSAANFKNQQIRIHFLPADTKK